MHDMETFEFVDVQKKNRKIILHKIILVTIYVFYVTSLLLIGTFIRIVAPLLAFIPLSLWILVFFTWKYTNIEYEYSITSGELTFSKIYGSRKRKVITKMMIKQFELVNKLDGREAADRLEMANPQKRYIAVSSIDDENVYYGVYKDDNGQNCVLYFKANDEALRIFRHYNSHAFMATWNKR
jgi:hypothetical protein